MFVGSRSDPLKGRPRTTGEFFRTLLECSSAAAAAMRLLRALLGVGVKYLVRELLLLVGHRLVQALEC